MNSDIRSERKRGEISRGKLAFMQKKKRVGK